MKFKEYFSTEPRGAKLEMAQYLGITQEWMSKLIAGTALPSLELCKKIEAATQGLVTRKDLRPDWFE